MSKTAKAEFEVRSWLTLRASIVIHSSAAAMRREYGALSGDVHAYVYFDEDEPTDDLCTLHFCPEHLTAATIAHEAFHAGLCLARRLRINAATDDGEEFLAEFTERCANRVFRLARQNRIKIRLVDTID